MIAVLDYGVGNVNSIVNMFKKIGYEAQLVSSPELLKKAEKVLLPGVGSFDTGINKLKNSGLYDAVIEHAVTKKKLLMGICLGMQMLGVASEEGKEKGLELIEFENKKFKIEEKNLKIPHMGWDIVEIKNKNDLIVDGIVDQQRYYFVHSYHAVCKDENNVLMTCNYGYEFTAAVKKDNIYGFQFHPEKSHKFGMRLLENFARMV